MRKPLQLIMHAAALIMILSVAGFSQRMQLTPEQRAQRLKDSLALSDEQFKGVTTLYEEMDAKRQVLFESSDGDRQSMRESMRSLLEQTDSRIDSLLTPEQRTKFAEMRKRQMERRQEFRRRNE